MSKTIYWSPSEASLGRASRNSLLEGSRSRKLDVTEEMMKAATIGRSSEFGGGWEPPGMVSRKIAALLTSGGRRADDNSQQVSENVKAAMENLKAHEELAEKTAASKPPVPREENGKAIPRISSMPVLTRDISWNSMLPSRRAGVGAIKTSASGAASAGVLQQAGTQVAQAMRVLEQQPDPSKNSTVHWVPKEPSLARDSYNAMIKKQNLDITEVMMRDAMMGKAAMMGPGWDPPGVVSRKIAEILTQK